MTLFAAGGPSVATQMVGSSLIGVREGLEASVVVMTLIAFAVKSGRRDSLKWIWAGVTAALVLTVGTFLAIQLGTNTISTMGAELVAGIGSIVAVVMVTFMVLWMRKASAHLSSDLKTGLSSALTVGGPAVALLAFLTVGREGFETALLMVAYAESVSGGVLPLVGLLTGVTVAAALTVALYRGAVRIDFNRFFLITGLFLIVVAAGILSYGIHAFQAFGWLPGLNYLAYDISSWYEADTWYGSILSGIFNIQSSATWLQMVAWITYIAVVGTAFVLRGRTGRATRTPKPSDLAAADTVDAPSA